LPASSFNQFLSPIATALFQKACLDDTMYLSLSFNVARYRFLKLLKSPMSKLFISSALFTIQHLCVFSINSLGFTNMTQETRISWEKKEKSAKK